MLQVLKFISHAETHGINGKIPQLWNEQSSSIPAKWTSMKKNAKENSQNQLVKFCLLVLALEPFFLFNIMRSVVAANKLCAWRMNVLLLKNPSFLVGSRPIYILSKSCMNVYGRRLIRSKEIETALIVPQSVRSSVDCAGRSEHRKEPWVHQPA